MTRSGLVVGANGAIGQAISRLLLDSGKVDKVIGVVRNTPQEAMPGVDYFEVNSTEEQAVKDFCEQYIPPGSLTYAVIASGLLHDQTAGVKPEKRLEDINVAALEAYFKVNSIMPMLWIKHLLKGLNHASRSDLVCLSARVGSIEDNALGGWYGYRASKSALNMLIKTAAVEYRRRAPNVVLTSYHPGTVNSGLSKPFQANVPQGKLFTPAFTADSLFTSLARCDATNGPYFIDWQGKIIPW